MKRAIATVVASIGLLFAAVGSTASAQPPPPPSPHLAVLDGGQAQGGFSALAGVDAANAYVARTFPASANPYVQHAAVVTVEQTNDATGYFYADSFAFNGGSSLGGYMGLQTQLNNPNNVGHGAITSIWGATGATAIASGASVVSGVESGQTFWSIHWPYNWSVGLPYQLTAVKSGTQVQVTLTLVGCCSEVIGNIYVPSSWGGFALQTNEFTEQYNPASYNACTDIAVSKAKFTTTWMHPTSPPVNIAPSSSNPYIQSGTGCTNSASISLGSGYYREIVGATS